MQGYLHRQAAYKTPEAICFVGWFLVTQSDKCKWVFRSPALHLWTMSKATVYCLPFIVVFLHVLLATKCLFLSRIRILCCCFLRYFISNVRLIDWFIHSFRSVSVNPRGETFTNTECAKINALLYSSNMLGKTCRGVTPESTGADGGRGS